MKTNKQTQKFRYVHTPKHSKLLYDFGVNPNNTDIFILFRTSVLRFGINIQHKATNNTCTIAGFGRTESDTS